MRRGPKSAKSKVESKPPLARKPPKDDGAKVRDLEKRLAESLEREKAAGEILRVISSSPASVQPTFEAIARAAMSLCEADIGSLFRFDGQLIHVGAFHGTPQEVEASRRAFPQRPGHGSVTARAILAATVVQIDDVSKDPKAADALRAFRTVLSVPMIRDGRPLGAITVARRVVRPFSDEQIELVKTFADQAVIAIENVRLFKDLEARNRDLTATSEILQVISRSPTDVHPVFTAIARSAAHLTGAVMATVYEFDGSVIHLRVVAPDDWPHADDLRRNFPRPPARNFAAGRVILDRAVLHRADLQNDPDTPGLTQALAGRMRLRGVLWVPMLRDGEPAGVIGVAREESALFSDEQVRLLQTFADQAVIAIENVRLFNELEERNRDLTETLEQQTATSEILRAISSSPTDTQPVFDAIAANAARLCDANDAQVLRVEGEVLHLVAASGAPSMPPVRQLTRGHLVGRAVIDRKTIHVRDLAQALAEYPETTAARYGVQSALAVPLMREGIALGVIRISRTEIQPFTDKQIALLQTFADQAVIAIENVRLFKELEARNAQLTELLGQQTATGEILSVIARSPTDIQPVFDTVVESAARLCDANDVAIYRSDGDRLRFVAHHGSIPPPGRVGEYFRTLERGSATGRSVLEGRILHIADLQAEADEFPTGSDLARRLGFRALLSVPLMRGGAAIGTIMVRRTEARLFSERQVALLQTFSDQAVIAIENVRLFTELQEKNSALTTAHGQVSEALERQTATSDILSVISQSPTDLQAVFDAIVGRAMRLCAGLYSALYRFDGELIHPGAQHNYRVAALDEVRRFFPARPSRAFAVGRAILERAVVHVPDVELDAEYRHALPRAVGARSILCVPMLRDGVPIGAIIVARAEPGPFASNHIELLRTFADQAVIAVENARLFKELEGANRELSAASQHKSEFLANMSHELRTPLNAIIGFSEVLSERMFGELNEKQEEYSKDIHASGQHLLSLINDILDLSKIEAGRMELELTDFHLPQAIDNALILVRERAGRRGIALEHSVDERLGEIRSDERKVKQVLLNLLSNALKFTPEGGRVEVRAGLVDDKAEISVTDTGVGIDPEDQEAVFEEFRQVGTADKRAEGTGLGLTLCRKFVELHGGRIWVKSQVGAGSTFTFTIPVHRGE